MSETPPDDPLRFDAPDAPAGGAHVRVLIIQSDVAPAESVAEAFPPIRYLVTYATDPLTVVATAVSRDIDVVVLDTPSYDVEVDSLLWRLDSESIRLPIVVVGSSPPPQPMRVRFPVRYLPKPVDPVRLAAEVESVLADAEAVRSAAVPLPPEQAAGRSKHPSGDFPEWTRMTRELARETGELVIAAPAPAPGAAEAPDVRIVEPPRTAPAPPAEPPAGAGAVPIERVLSVGERDAVGPPALAGRSAAVAGSDPAITSGLGVVLRDAGMDVREVAREPLAALPEIRARPPDVVAVDPGTRDDVARVLQALRADVRLWHRPIVVVSARPDVLDAARLLGRGADEALRAEAPEREILSKIGVLLAPLEQAREHIAKDRTASGEIGPVGVVAVVRIAAATRREARAVLRGDGRLAEIDLLDGQIAAVRLTEPDGRYATGVEALTPMLALRSGRWSVRPLPLARPGASLRLPIPGALWDAADRLTELLSHATPDLVLRVRRLRLRERAGAARGFSAAEIRARERLQTGDAPRTLLGAPGMTVDGIARLVEKLILAGEVAALEEEEAGRIDVTTAPAGAAAARPAAELPAALFRTGRPSEGPLPQDMERPPIAHPIVLPPPARPVAPPSPAGDAPAAAAPPPSAPAPLPTAAAPPSPPPAAPPSCAVAAGEVADAVPEPSGQRVAPPLPPVARTEASAVTQLLAEAAGSGEVERPGSTVPVAPNLFPSPSSPPAASPQPVPPPGTAGPLPVPSGPPPRRFAAPVPVVVPAAARPAAPAPPQIMPAPSPRLSPPPLPRRVPPPPLPPSVPELPREPRAAAARGSRPRTVAFVALGFAVAGLVAAGAIYLAGRARSPAGPPPDEAPAVALAPDVAASPDAAIPPDGAPAVPRVLLPDVAPAAPDDVPPAVPRVVLPDVAPVGPDVALAVPDVGVRPAPDVASIAEARSVAEAPFIAPAEPAPDAAPVPDLVPDRASPDAAPSPREVAAARDDAGRVDRAARPPRDAGEPAVPSGRAVLVVPRPEGVDVEIAVFVDGVRRGAAPVQVELDPGDHEVRFEAAGRHSLSVVHLAAGERKTLVPRQLIRELARPPD